MHILIVHKAFAQPDQPGGTRHIELSRVLAAAGHRVTVVTVAVSYLQADAGHAVPDLPAEEELEPGITVVRCTGGSSQGNFAGRLGEMLGFMVRSFFRARRVKDVDLVWASSPTLFQAFSALCVAGLKGKASILEIRDIWPDALVDIGALRNPAAIAISRWLAAWMYRRANHIIVNSPGFRPALMAKGVPAERLTLIPNGVDITMFDPQANARDLRARLGWEGAYIALYSGAHGMANDLDTLLDAAERLQDCPQARIVLLGDGPEKARLRVRVQSMGLDNIQFFDPVAKREMAAMLAAADCCVAILKPSCMQAMVYPNKVFDYMAAARPTVLAIGGVIRDVIEEAEGGLAVPPGDPQALADAIRLLASDPETGRAMGRRARAHVEAHFHRQAIGASLVRLLEQIVH